MSSCVYNRLRQLEEVRREIEEAFTIKGYEVVGVLEKDADFIIYLKVPKKKEMKK